MKWLLKYAHPAVKLIQTDALCGIAAFHKPCSILSHPNGTNGDESIDGSLITLKYNYKDESFRVQSEEVSRAEKFIYLLNRLDSATSGVILVSSSKETAKSVKSSFSHGRRSAPNPTTAVSSSATSSYSRADSNKDVLVNKVYYAVSFTDEPFSSSGSKINMQRLQDIIGREMSWTDTITIENNNNHLRARAINKNPSSKINSSSSSSSSSRSVSGTRDCKTKVTVIQVSSFNSADSSSAESNPHLSYVLLKLEPLTGYTHQLRYQCQVRGFPIVGDKVYGNFKKNKMFLKRVRSEFVSTATSGDGLDAGSGESGRSAAASSFNRLFLHSFGIHVMFDGSHIPVTATAADSSDSTVDQERLKYVAINDDDVTNASSASAKEWRSFSAVSALPPQFTSSVFGFRPMTFS